MEEGRKHIDDLFREGLEGYREMPDAAVWTSIEQRLPKRGGRRSFLWLWILLMLALLSSLGYYANRQYSLMNVEGDKPGSNSSGSDLHHPLTVNDANSASPMQADSAQAMKDIDADKEEETGKANSAGIEKELSDDERSTAQDHGNEKASIHRQVTNGQIPAQNSTVRESDDDATTASENSKATKEEERSANNEKTGYKNNADKVRSDESEVRKENKKDKSSSEKGLKEAAIGLQPDTISPAGVNTRKQSSANKQPSASNKQQPSPKGNPSETQTSKDVFTNAEKNKNSPPLKPQHDKPTPVNPASATQKPALPPGEKTTKDPLSPEKSASAPGTQEATSTNAKKESYPDNNGLSKGKPETVQPEKSSAAPVTVVKEEAKAAPIFPQAEPNSKKSKIEVTYQDAKGSPIIVEPEKEYGIKIEDATENNNDDNGTSNNGDNGGGGGGTGGAAEGKTKNRIKIDGGVKLGYDRGFADVTTSNFTGNLFLQWNISPRTSLVIQPGLRYHSVNKTSLFPRDAYHQVTSESLDSAHVESDSFGIPLIQRNYIYRNSYDSISMTYALAPQKYIEIELPLLLQYKLAENFSVFGGMQLAFGKILEIQGSRQSFQGSKLDTVSFPTVFFDTTVGPPDRPELSGYFSYPTPEISELDENKYKNPITNPARFGAMLGFSYEYKKRLLIDLLVRKNLSNLNYIPNEQVRKIYSQPYFRITVGYKLFRSK